MANGYILWEGASLIDGAPIVVIATGFASRSTNRKTGGMVQTYILRRDIDPVSAVQSGDDASICGDCPHRGIVVDQRLESSSISQGGGLDRLGGIFDHGLGFSLLGGPSGLRKLQTKVP